MKKKWTLLLCVKKKNELNGYKGIGDFNLIKSEKKNFRGKI